MKIKTKLILVTIWLLLTQISVAQNNYGAIRVTLVDKTVPPKEDGGLAFTSITVYTDDSVQRKGITDLDGNCSIKPLKPGKYNVKATQKGYQTSIVKNVIVFQNKNCYLNMSFVADSTNTKAPKIIEYTLPVIDPQ